VLLESVAVNYPPAHHILQVALPVPLPRVFDYLCPPEIGQLTRGTRVLAPFGKRNLVGIVTGTASESSVSNDRLLPVIKVFDDCKPLLNTELMKLLDWCCQYYKHAPGEIFANAIPPSLRRARGELPPPIHQFGLTKEGRSRLLEEPGRAKQQFALLEHLSTGPLIPEQLNEWKSGWRTVMKRLIEQEWVCEELAQFKPIRPANGPELTREQLEAVQSIAADLGRFRCHLLDGITGSGKTEIYLELIREVLVSGRQALVLVPEIGLTPQLIRRFSERLGVPPAVYHSGLSDGQRLATWAAARSGQARLLLGTRSALFLPLSEPGLIVMDESHDSSFKQQEGFRFSARDVAVKRAAGLGIPIVLGSATPSLETIQNAVLGKYSWNRLRSRATGAKPPVLRVEDMRHMPAKGGLLDSVIQSIEETLDKGEQALVFLNRRGYAPVLLCHECGWHASCSRCDANLTWHRNIRTLVCHHCEHRQGVPTLCPECGADALQGAGEGTQQLEQLLQRKFPQHPLYRFDRDQLSRKGAFEALYEKVRSGGACILVGTQMLAKGHHFPLVTRVVIVNLDQALYSGDYRALERLGQLMVQVAGRAGREERPGEVILQTHHPDHPLLESLFRDGYEVFATELLKDRQLAGLPPFSFQATLRAQAHDRKDVTGFLQDAQDRFSGTGVKVYGPYPAQMEKRSGMVRWYLLLQSERRPSLQSGLENWLPLVRALPASRRVRWTLDVDPQEF
jgi:primosomal protein N' (replication factor Y)